LLFVADPWLGGSVTVATRMLAENLENQRKTGENFSTCAAVFMEFLIMERQRKLDSFNKSNDFYRWKGYSPPKSKPKNPTQP
jgi:hypothetical protein